MANYDSIHTGSDIDAAVSAIQAGTFDSITIGGEVVSPYTFKNVLMNGEVTRINQAGFNGVSWVNGEYGYDGWLATTSNMVQVVEFGNFVPNIEYTLSGIGVTTQQVTSPVSGNWTIPEIPRTATQVQLEQGSVATNFELIPEDLALSRCQRYYERMAIGIYGGHIVATDNHSVITWFFKVEKVNVPTVTNPVAGAAYVNWLSSSTMHTSFKLHNYAPATTTDAIADARLYS